MTKPQVVVETVDRNPEAAIHAMFGRFPDIARRIKECKSVFIKVNAVYFHPHLHTSLSLIESVVRFIQGVDPKKRIYLMENCSQATFTRMCFAAIGINSLAKKLRIRCLYLDEEKWEKLEMAEGDKRGSIRFPRILHDHLLSNRKQNFYLNMPVLKAHCQAQMTAGIKNQMGLLYDIDKARNHNHRLHQKLVDILKFIRPDFTLVDALKVLARGPAPPARFMEERLHEKDVIIGGIDTVAVDAVCATILGHKPEAIKHVALAAQQGMGVADLDEIDVVGKIPPVLDKIPWEAEIHFPENIRFVVGKDGACYEGCLGFSEQVVELLVNENGTPENIADLPLTIVTGKGFDPNQIKGLREPIILLGKCACNELLDAIVGKYSNVDVANTCGRIDDIFALVAHNLAVDLSTLSPLSRLDMLRHFILGKVHGLDFRRYRISRRTRIRVGTS